jgi:hypothetical protein
MRRVSARRGPFLKDVTRVTCEERLYIARLVVVYYCSTCYKVRLCPHRNCRATLFLETLVKHWSAQRQGPVTGLLVFAMSEFLLANSDTKTLVARFQKVCTERDDQGLRVSFFWFLSLVSLVTNLW